MRMNTTIRTLHCYGCGRDLPETSFDIDCSVSVKRGRAYRCVRCRIDAFPVGIDRPVSLNTQGYTPQQIDAHNQSLKVLASYLRCQKCGAQGKAVIARRIDSAGRSIIRGWCLSCHSEGDKSFKHSDMQSRGIVLDLLPTYQTAEAHVCSFRNCERTDTQLHHWLPRHIADFDLTESFPQSYLCPDHHHLWHKLVTPNMSNGNGHKELP